jgi:2-dehydro-3-deoxyphosphogluconate aldolase/(4S)-4-hydroxy-2-oxoglutarate aldolase
VLSLDDLRAAGDAGASFIVLPTLVADVVGECVRRSVPVFPGGLTPQEIHHAWWAGATMVKVFPAGAFGPSYIREIKGPFADIELLACGGVNADNLGDYFAAGASAVAFGASVFRGEWFSAREYAQIGAEIEKLIGALRTWQARSG